MMIKKIDTQRGSSLIEVMIAVFVFLIGMEALLAVSLTSMKQGSRAEYVYAASTLAKNHLERLKGYTFSALSTAAETDVQVNADGDADTDGAFYRSTSVTTSYSGNANMTQVTVSVRYRMQSVLAGAPMQISQVFYNES